MHRGARKDGLSRRHRYAVQGSFGPVLRSSRKIRGTLALLHVSAGRPGVSRLGIALTRRIAPSSVHRNQVKRMVRELFRRHAVKTAGLDLVVGFREKLDFDGKVAARGPAALRAELGALLDQVVR